MRTFNKAILILLLSLLTTSLSATNLPVQSRELLFIDANAFEIGIDNDPVWKWNKDEDINVIEFTAQTPEQYYPPAIVTVRYHKDILTNSDELQTVAKSAVQTIENSFHVKESSVNAMRKIQYRSLVGYEVMFRSKVNGEQQDIQLVIAKSPSGNLMSLMTLTLPDKVPHIQPALKRIYDNIKFK